MDVGLAHEEKRRPEDDWELEKRWVPVQVGGGDGSSVGWGRWPPSRSIMAPEREKALCVKLNEVISCKIIHPSAMMQPILKNGFLPPPPSPERKRAR